MTSQARQLLYRGASKMRSLLNRQAPGEHMVAQAAVPAPVGASSCGWAVAEENRRGRRVGAISIRRYPFPYRCALSVNNDTDCFRHAPFEAFHAFVSGRGETRFGTGLGLEVADSFWVWAYSNQLCLYQATPWTDDPQPSPEHDRLLELARAGWLDTLHGFGAWMENRPVERDRIARALDYLDSKGVKLKVYVGHGGYNMAHNFGGPWGYYQNADNPKHVSYCHDLLTDYGFRYHWTDVAYELDKFGDDLTFDSQEQLNAEVARHDFNRYFYCNDPEDYARAREVFPGLDADGLAAWRRRLFNHTIVPVQARDGRPAMVFKRFRGHDGPMAGNFIAQVNPGSLDALEKRQGAAIVYQHFGVWRALFMGKRHASQRWSEPDTVLDEHNVWAFRTLAERFREGRVLVATTRRLLDFLWMRDNLDYRVAEESGRTVIRIDAIDCPVDGRVVPDAAALAGLAFEVPKSLGEPVVLVEETKLSTVSVEDPADPNRLVVHLPWQTLEFPA